jgi:GNAT superfamily N-acetyltransferase
MAEDTHMPMQIEFRPGHVDSGDGADLAQAMRDEMAAVYDGLQLDGPDMPKAGPTELSPPRGAFLVGYSGGMAVCCGGLKELPDGSCEIKKMFVSSEARGQGVARTLLGALEDEARRLGYTTVRLDTGHKQPHAKALYASAGYREIENFNANPVASYFAEKQL